MTLLRLKPPLGSDLVFSAFGCGLAAPALLRNPPKLLSDCFGGYYFSSAAPPFGCSSVLTLLLVNIGGPDFFSAGALFSSLGASLTTLPIPDLVIVKGASSSLCFLGGRSSLGSALLICSPLVKLLLSSGLFGLSPLSRILLSNSAAAAEASAILEPLPHPSPDVSLS